MKIKLMKGLKSWIQFCPKYKLKRNKVNKLIKAGIFGATGYSGSEVARLLMQHPEVDLKVVSSKSYTGEKYREVYESFNKFTDLECVEGNIERMAEETDVIFLALPHGHASKLITEDVLKKAKIIDIGADFRLKSVDEYKKWYGVEHYGENLLEKSVYGLCEWNRKKIKNADLVANPGCYSLCSLLGIIPLIKDGIIDTENIIIDAKSGVTGAGRSLALGTHYTECNESLKAYKVTSHRHTPEIEQELSGIAGKKVIVTFTPHLIPMNRGILSTIYCKLKQGTEYEEIKDIYENHYGDEYFIRLTKNGVYPETKWVKGSNFCDIGFSIDNRTGNLIIISAIDNMVKGAAGQAVQNMNIMFGFEETLGLKTIPISF
jgi:N-acetyl-gamma-glutamyl-phosphate reductase